jgi:hypothetical protein
VACHRLSPSTSLVLRLSLRLVLGACFADGLYLKSVELLQVYGGAGVVRRVIVTFFWLVWGLQTSQKIGLKISKCENLVVIVTPKRATVTSKTKPPPMP